MAFRGMTLTNRGRNLLSQAQINKTFHIKCVRVGDGQYSGDFKDISALVNPVYDVPAEFHHEGNNLLIDADISSNDHSGYYLREIAVIALDSDGNEVVYAYDNAGDDAEFISPSETVAYENRLRFCFAITSDLKITLELNGNAYALVKDLLNVTDRVSSLETNGVRVADTLPKGSQVLFRGRKEDIPSHMKISTPPFSNPNLLINGDLRVWQRGQNFAGDSTQLSRYTADRWLCTFTTGNNVLKSEDGTGLVYQRNSVNQSVVRQLIELDTKMGTLLIGKKVTMSQTLHVTVPAIIKYGVGRQRKTIKLQAGVNEIVDAFLLTEADIENKGGGQVLDYLAFAIDGSELTSINLKLAKLELGDLATPFVPRNYGEELALCQRYYINFDKACLGGYSVNNDGGGWFMLQRTMRAKPSYKGIIHLYQPNTGTYASSSVQIYKWSQNTIMFLTKDIAYSNPPKTFAPNVHLYIYGNDGFELDAEIY